MKYSLPFGLKQKPLRKYFAGGSIGFECREGKLFYVIITTRTIHLIKPERYVKEKYPKKEVKNIEHLERLMAIKSLNEIPSLEVVN